MKSICKVCGNEVVNWNMNIIKGASGEWVCKECLQKAKIGKVKFGCTNISSDEIRARIQGTYIPVDKKAKAQSVNADNKEKQESSASVVSNGSSSICCHKCGSDNIVPITEVETKGKDFKADDACCGFLLCGPIGLLCGALGKGKQTTSTTYWICKNCGNKFKA